MITSSNQYKWLDGGKNRFSQLLLLTFVPTFFSSLVTDLQLDSNDEARVRLNFNITMMDIKCDYVVVDVISVLGTEQNVSNHITKWHVDGNGIRQRYQGRNKQQRDLHLFDTSVTMTLEELHEDGEDAISLTEETFEYARKQQEYLFVDFYASWYVFPNSLICSVFLFLS